MKNLLPIAVALSLFLGLGLAQDPPPEQAPDQALAHRVEVLEQEVLTLKQEVQAGKALAVETARYIEGAKERSEALLQTFDDAEKANFVAGINFTSREILLAGLRAYARSEAAGLPGTKEPEEKKPEAKLPPAKKAEQKLKGG
jgi:hypothetical protein